MKYKVGDKFKLATNIENIKKHLQLPSKYINELISQKTFTIVRVDSNSDSSMPYYFKYINCDTNDFYLSLNEVDFIFTKIIGCKCGSYKRIGNKHHSWCLEYGNIL